MFKLPNLPSPKASDDELADFVEVIAWQKGFASATDIVGYLGLTDDNVDGEGEVYEGCEDQEDEHLTILESVFELLEQRQTACGESYPFDIVQAGSVLRLLDLDEQPGRELYLYLLCATRIRMSTNKVIDGIDGALLMEELCSKAIKEYLGIQSAKSVVLGTASRGGFRERVTQLLREIDEPAKFANIDGEDAAVYAQDDGVDVVGWIPFGDGAPGKLSLFAQVKTGTSWRDSVKVCQPENFLTKWVSGRFLVPPLRAYCVAESVSRGSRWNSSCADAGVFFDRCRIVACLDIENVGQAANVRSWVAGAKDLISGSLTV